MEFCLRDLKSMNKKLLQILHVSHRKQIMKDDKRAQNRWPPNKNLLVKCLVYYTLKY